jgi:hypothetical protein
MASPPLPANQITLDPAEVEKIVTAINAAHSDGWFHWVPVASVFVSALLAMIVGMVLDHYKTRRERRRAADERLNKELTQIDGALAVIAYNVEILTHAVFQHLLPHWDESHAAIAALTAAIGHAGHMSDFASSFNNYRGMQTTCPEMFFIEYDYIKEINFIISEDAELIKQSGWMISQCRLLNNAIRDRNRHIENSGKLSGGSLGDPQHFARFNQMLTTHQSLATVACILSLQLFRRFQDTQERLTRIGEAYQIPGRRPIQVTLPEAVAQAMERLQAIMAEMMPNMPSNSHPE